MPARTSASLLRPRPLICTSVLFLALSLAPAPASADDDEPGQSEADSSGESEEGSGIQVETTFAFAIGLPHGELRDNGLDTGFGFDATALAGGRGWPVLIGLELGYIAYGESTATVPLSPTFPSAFVDLATKNGILNFNGLVRVQPWQFFVTPYVDGLGGLKYFQTTTVISDPSTGNAISTTVNFSDTTWSAGVGGGMLIGGSGEGEGGGFGLDLGLRYLWGGRATYALEGLVPSVSRANTISSRTDLFVFYIGLYVRL